MQRRVFIKTILATAAAAALPVVAESRRSPLEERAMREGVLLVERAIHWWPADGQVRHSEIIEFEQARVGDPRMHRPFEPDTRWWRVTRAPERRDDAAKADMVCAPIMDAA